MIDYKSLSDEELLGQLLCADLTGYKNDEDVFEYIRENKPGGLFVNHMPKEKIKLYADYANSVCKYPVLVCVDAENGPGSALRDLREMPNPMAWGATDDEELIEKAGIVTAKVLRKNGINFTFSPLVDINVNKDNPVVNIRAISDGAEAVARIGSAHIRGLQHKGYTVATAKHFPGDGVDDRNAHFCTTVNSLSKEEWDKTFGMVYKTVIDGGVASVMACHIALPAYDDDKEMPPAIFSHALLTDMLKNKLEFDGCIVSDAMSMVGACSVCPLDELAARYLNAGGDMVLFPEKNDLKYMLAALKNGTLSHERVYDAVERVLKLKEKARLFEDQNAILAEIEDNIEDQVEEIAREIARKSIKVVRNEKNILPLNLKKGDKVLVINFYLDNPPAGAPVGEPLHTFTDELRARGLEVDVYHKINHKQLEEIMDDYAAIFVNSKISSRDYYGGTLRIGWRDGIMTFWRGYALKHPKLIFTSFGDPYKLYELPFLKTYINTHSNVPASESAAVEVILGEIEPTAKNPVALPGFFEREI